MYFYSTNIKANRPNMLSIINKSITKLEKIMKEPEIDMIYDMMRITHKKVLSNVILVI